MSEQEEAVSTVVDIAVTTTVVISNERQAEAAELAMRRAVQNPRKLTVRVTRADGPLRQTHCQNLPELIVALESGWSIHPSDV